MGMIQKAEFRIATKEEVAYAKGGFAYQCVKKLWVLVCKVMGTVEVYFKGPNIVSWNIPWPQTFIEKFAYLIGCQPEFPFLRRFYTIFGDRIFLSDKVSMDALFEHFRRDEILEIGTSMKAIFNILCEIFPDDNIKENDLMVTCEKEHVKPYRNLLLKNLSQAAIKTNNSMISETIDSVLKKWEEKSKSGGIINSTEETMLFTSSIITKMAFGSDNSSSEIAKSINFLNRYVVNKFLNQVTDEDQHKYHASLKTLKEAIESVLTPNRDLPIFRGVELTRQQKKAMIFVLYFAGQETTASLLNYILWQLAKDPKKQAELRTGEDIRKFFLQSLKDLNPAYGVARLLKTDTCFEYTLEGQTTPHKVIMLKDEYVVANIHALAKKVLEIDDYNDWHAFGYKKHRCPGDHLAREEIIQFLTALLKNYTIETTQQGPNPIVGFITAQLANEVQITIKRK